MKILVTGGTNGMGKGVAKTLAALGNPLNEVIILCRNQSLGQNTVKELLATTANPNISFVLCDLCRPDDVKKVIEEINSKHNYLDGIFINAGLGYAASHIETENGLDAHFQVNYLSQFLLTLNLLSLLEKSAKGGRIIFNVIEHGKIFWDDLQFKNNWSYKKALLQAMVAKRLFVQKLYQLYSGEKNPKLSFIGFEIPKTVWTNQVRIIPSSMRIMATIMKGLGQFISIEQCGKIIAPLFMESREDSLNKSGKFITFKHGRFSEIQDDSRMVNQENIDRLWEISLHLCNDEKTRQIARELQASIITTLH